MWSDNETTRDFLNFRHVASIVAEMILRADGKPLSIGVSGGWGVGKSSMVQLIGETIKIRGGENYLIVPFNAWLYQGYDDVRAALMETITRALAERVKDNKGLLGKVKDLGERIDWLRTAGLIAGSGLGLALGVGPIGVFGEVYRGFKALKGGSVDQSTVETATEAAGKAVKTGKSIVKEKKPELTPSAAIDQLRLQFQTILKELDVTLVVLIDDLDRCLPPTTISTLEAIRLFLFLDRSAFVIAADDRMIREAVKAHFHGMQLDDQLVTSYFDKLIQVPVRVPPLGTQDVRAYLMLLFIDNSELDQDQKEDLRVKVCEQLGKSWKGLRTDRQYVGGLIADCPAKLAAQLDLADRLAPILTTSTRIAGNPRLIKRFLNTVEVRMSIAKENGVTADESVLAKLYLLERCGEPQAYESILTAVNRDDEGKAKFLAELESKIAANPTDESIAKEWRSAFSREWLGLKPDFGDIDLRPALYVSREHLPMIGPEDQISPEGLTVLQGLLSQTGPSPALVDSVKVLSSRECGLLLDRLLGRARAVQSWGTPPILYACLTVVDADPTQAGKLATFLQQIPGHQLSAPLVPILGSKTWAEETLAIIAGRSTTPQTVKAAIAMKDK